MEAGRLEAFSDGVIAIIVTIMVLELKAPDHPDVASIAALWPTLLAYGLSFTLVSIYWVNHHHIFHTARKVGREILWLNIHWLFWLSLFPFATAYLSNTRGADLSIAIYAGLGTVTAVAFLLLGMSLGRRNADIATVRKLSPRRKVKNYAAILSNVAAIGFAFISPPLALVLIAAPAVAYFLPDKEAEAHG